MGTTAYQKYQQLVQLKMYLLQPMLLQMWGNGKHPYQKQVRMKLKQMKLVMLMKQRLLLKQRNQN